MKNRFPFFCLLFILSSLSTVASAYNLTSETTSQNIGRVRRIVVREDIDLGGRTLTLEKNSKLVFKGGSVTNGVLVLNQTKITGDIRIYCHVDGSLRNKVVDVDWFIPNNDLDALYEMGFFNLTGFKTVRFGKQDYLSGVRSMNEGITVNNVIIDGNGATIHAKKGGRNVNSLLLFSDCNDIEIRNLSLEGSEEDSKEEGARHNLCLYNCNDVKLNSVISNNSFTDGLYIRACRDVIVRRFESYRSGRQGCSITAGRNLSFYDCTFDGSYRVAPKAGVDIEPNYSTDTIDNITFKDCSFTNNESAGLTLNLCPSNTTRQCNIFVEHCFFDGNGLNITLASDSNSGEGVIDISNCTLLNSKGVSFQSKCYSAIGTPLVKFHDSVLENANLAGGKDVREQATLISVHNISSRPLSCEYGNIQFYNLVVKQNKDNLSNLRNAVVIYPDPKYRISNVTATDITFEIEKEEGRNFELLSAPDAIKKNSRLINKAVIKAK